MTPTLPICSCSATRDELIGCSSVELGILSAAARAQNVDHVLHQPAPAPFEVQMRTKSGAPVEVVTAIDTVEFDGVPCLLTMAVDVTERKAAEHDRLFLSALVASSPEAVVGRTVDGTILSWNRGAEHLFGYTAEEAIGQNLTMLAAPGTRPYMEEVMAAVAAGNAVEGVETQRITNDGRI